jgi:hypothetical protein
MPFIAYEDMPNDMTSEWREEKAKNERLREEVAMWKERYEAERRDHEATIKHCDEMLRSEH